MLLWSNVCKELENRGWPARKKNLNLDSDARSDFIRGIVVDTKDASKEHVFWVDALLEGAGSVPEAAEFLIGLLQKSALPPNVDYDSYLTKDYLLSNARVAFKNRLWAPYLQKDSVFPGISEYCYVYGVLKKSNVRWMLEIREDHIQAAGLTDLELWDAAHKNTHGPSADFVLDSLVDVLGKRAEKYISVSPLRYCYCVTSRSGIQGAIQVLNSNLIGLCKEYLVTSLVVYPQSPNNFLVGPDLPGVKDAILSVAENDSANAQLGDKLFMIKFDSDSNIVLDSEIPYRLAY